MPQWGRKTANKVNKIHALRLGDRNRGGKAGRGSSHCWARGREGLAERVALAVPSVRTWTRRCGSLTRSPHSWVLRGSHCAVSLGAAGRVHD